MRAPADTGVAHKVSGPGRIPLSRPEISGNEWRYVKDCLDSGWVSSAGDYVERFEKKVAEYVGTKCAVATVNGTAALHLALLACGVGKGDEVIVPSLTFIATANAVSYAGAHPVFMDCEEATLCVDPAKVLEFLKKECGMGPRGYCYNKRTKRRVAAFLPVHVLGHPAEMGPFLEVQREHNVTVIEDSAQALGSEYRGRKAGSTGRAGCLSFNGNKIMTCGGGGMVVTDDSAAAERARHISTQAKEPHPYEFMHGEAGYNYRFNALQAAMGLAQAERLDEFVTIKRRNAAIYRELLSGLDEVDLLREKPWAKSNFWLCTIRVPARDKTGLIERLLSEKIEARPLWKPLNTLPMHGSCQSYAVEKAQEAYERCICLPSSVGITDMEMERVAGVISRYFRG